MQKSGARKRGIGPGVGSTDGQARGLGEGGEGPRTVSADLLPEHVAGVGLRHVDPESADEAQGAVHVPDLRHRQQVGRGPLAGADPRCLSHRNPPRAGVYLGLGGGNRGPSVGSLWLDGDCMDDMGMSGRLASSCPVSRRRGGPGRRKEAKGEM